VDLLLAAPSAASSLNVVHVHSSANRTLLTDSYSASYDEMLISLSCTVFDRDAKIYSLKQSVYARLLATSVYAQLD